MDDTRGSKAPLVLGALALVGVAVFALRPHTSGSVIQLPAGTSEQAPDEAARLATLSSLGGAFLSYAGARAEQRSTQETALALAHVNAEHDLTLAGVQERIAHYASDAQVTAARVTAEAQTAALAHSEALARIDQQTQLKLSSNQQKADTHRSIFDTIGSIAKTIFPLIL